MKRRMDDAKTDDSTDNARMNTIRINNNKMGTPQTNDSIMSMCMTRTHDMVRRTPLASRTLLASATPLVSMTLLASMTPLARTTQSEQMIWHGKDECNENG